MFSIFSWAPKAQHNSDSVVQPGSIRIGDAKRISWAFEIGEYRPSANAPHGRAPRRGDLPDVDFSQVVRAPRRSIWSRIVSAFRASGEQAPKESRMEVGAKADLAPAQPENVIPFRRAA